MGLQMPASSGQLWENPQMPWPVMPTNPSANWVQRPAGTELSMPMDCDFGRGQIAAQLGAAAIHYGLDREQIAAQLMAAAPCHYED